MTPANVARGARLWEWSAELDTIHHLEAGTSEPGHRIRYRQQGGTRWRTFLLLTADGSSPTESMVLRAIEEHAGIGSADGR